MSRDLVITPRDLVRDCRCSLALDGVDDRVAGTIPATLDGSDPWTVIAQIKCSRLVTANTTAVVFMGNGGAAHQYAACGTTAVGSLTYFGIQVSGVQPRSVRVADLRWHRVAYRFTGGAGGLLSVTVDGTEIGTPLAWPAPNLRTTVGTLGGEPGMRFPGNVVDARIYTRCLSDAEVLADFRGEWVDPTGLVRRWTCENPGYGTTCREEIGGTDDTITGATWSPIVPFRHRSLLKAIPAVVRFPGTSFSFVTIPDHDDLRPGSGSWGAMFWFRQNRFLEWASLIQKGVESGGQAGWVVGRDGYGGLSIRVSDGVTTTVYAPGTSIATHDHLHLALVCDRDAGKLLYYTNGGPPVVCSLGALGSVDTSNPLRIGGVAGWSNKFLGTLGELVWRKGAAFTWDEIRNHFFDGQVPACPSGCKQIGWAMDENGGTTVHSSPAGYDGTLSSDSWTTSTRCRPRDVANLRDAA